MDLVNRSVASVAQLPSGVQPSIMLDEFSECEEAVRRSPLFQEALRKRGVTDADLVMVEPWSAGMYGTELPEDEGVRRMRALCFVRSEPKDNGYARPIDSMVIVVDLYKMEVIRIEEYPIAPLPPESGNWAREYIPNMRKDLKPVDIVQPEGPSFTVEGNEVQWQKWKFRVGFTSREGLVLHTIAYDDNGRGAADPLSRVDLRDGGAIWRSERAVLPEERVRHRRIRPRECWPTRWRSVAIVWA